MKSDWTSTLPPTRSTGDAPVGGVAADMNLVRTVLTEVRSNVPNAPGDVAAAAASHTHAATDLASGTVATARLGSGTASSSTYLRGDQTWATLSGLQATLVDAAGDLLVGSAADTVVRMARGADGQVLTVDLDQATGLAWAAAPTLSATFLINALTGTSYTLTLADFAAPTIVRITNAAANSVTIPPNSTAAIAVGSSCVLQQWGAGQMTVLPGSGVTLRSYGSATKTAGQYAGATLLKVATNEWWLTGDVTS